MLIVSYNLLQKKRTPQDDVLEWEKLKLFSKLDLKYFSLYHLPKFVEIRKELYFNLDLDFSSNTMHRIKNLLGIKSLIFHELFKNFKHKEVESLVQMTCIDLTNFFEVMM